MFKKIFLMFLLIFVVTEAWAFAGDNEVSEIMKQISSHLIGRWYVKEQFFNPEFPGVVVIVPENHLGAWIGKFNPLLEKLSPFVSFYALEGLKYGEKREDLKRKFFEFTEDKRTEFILSTFLPIVGLESDKVKNKDFNPFNGNKSRILFLKQCRRRSLYVTKIIAKREIWDNHKVCLLIYGYGHTVEIKEGLKKKNVSYVLLHNPALDEYLKTKFRE